MLLQYLEPCFYNNNKVNLNCECTFNDNDITQWIKHKSGRHLFAIYIVSVARKTTLMHLLGIVIAS